MNEAKKRFIAELAKFLASEAAGKSICLEVESKIRPASGIYWAREWAALRNTTPLFGYLTVEETQEKLEDFLG